MIIDSNDSHYFILTVDSPYGRETSLQARSCFPFGTANLTWFFKSNLGHGRPPLNGFSRNHLDRIFSPLPQGALQVDHPDQSLSLQSRGQGMWQTSSARPAREIVLSNQSAGAPAIQDHANNVIRSTRCLCWDLHLIYTDSSGHPTASFMTNDRSPSRRRKDYLQRKRERGMSIRTCFAAEVWVNQLVLLVQTG